MGLTTLDTAIVFLYLVGTVAFGTYLGRGIRSVQDYFLGGRRLPWWAIGMSLVVSDIGALDIIGAAGAAYLFGVVVCNFDWLGCVPVMIIAAFVMIPIFWRTGAYSVPEYLGRRYNLAVRTIMAVVWGVFLTCNLAIMLFASAKMFQGLVGWEINSSIILLGIFIGIYTLVGGLTAVVYTDVIQCILMFAGCTIILVKGLIAVGGIGPLIETVQGMGESHQNHFTLVLPADTESPYPWPGILLGLGFVLAPAYWFGNQAIVQRALGARSEFDVKAGYVWGALLKTFIPIIIMFPGVIAVAINPGMEDGDLAIPLMFKQLLPPGLLGLIFAAFLAALMSSVDSALNSAATLWTNDIYRRFIRKTAEERHYMRVGRLLTFVLILAAICIAPFVERIGRGVYAGIQTLLSVFQGPALAIILLGVLWSRATGWGAVAGLIAGVATSGLLLHLKETLFQIQDPFLYAAWWSFVVAVVVTVVVSLLTPPEPPEKIRDLVYRRKRTA